MRGSIVKRIGKDGKPLYYITYYANGKKKWEAGSKNENDNSTRGLAEKLPAERLSQIHRGEFVEPTRITFEAFKDIWMEKYAEGEGQIRPSTLTLYRGLFRNHLVPALGDKQLSAITVEEVQGFKAEKMNHIKNPEAENPKTLSPQTVKHMLRLLRQMFDHAIDWGYLRTNPAKKVCHPKIPKREMDALTPEEVRLLLEHIP